MRKPILFPFPALNLCGDPGEAVHFFMEVGDFFGFDDNGHFFAPGSE